MTRKEKLLKSILYGNPSDVRFEDLEKALIHLGWHLDRVKGSHHIYRSPKGLQLTLPKHGKHIKPAYVRQARELIKL